MADTIPSEDPFERFLSLYATPERGQLLWKQWMETQPETVVTFMEKAADDLATEAKVSVEDARTRLAVLKLVEDRGNKFVERFLREHDTQQRPLKPLQLPRKRR